MNLEGIEENKLFIKQIEIDITNKCNLNCASCTHFSPLTKEVVEYDLTTFENDMKRLSTLFVISNIKLLGGEPFLYSRLDELVKLTTNYFPKSKISIYTNGTLRNEIIDLKNKYPKINIVQSKYPMINDVDLIATKKDKTKFRHPLLNIDGNSNPIDAKLVCHSKDCISLFNGRLYICPIMRNIKIFEQSFNLDLGLSLDDYSIDIYTHNNIEILVFLLSFNEGLKSCRYCSEFTKSIDWHISNKDIKEWIK